MDEEGLESALETKDYNLIDNFADKYLFWLKNYYYTGGMPAVVDAFRLNKDYAEVRQIQSDIVRQYEVILESILKQKFSQEYEWYGILFRCSWRRRIKNFSLDR